MFRFSRPLLNAVTKRSTGITGLNVHPNPLPKLVETYKSTLSVLSSIPSTSVYRQGAEAVTKHRLSIVEKANGSISAVESELHDGQIEQTLDIATDELNLAKSMLEWKAWEPLEEKPPAGQWEYFGQTTTAASSS
ncbi:NADH2 dehydrogenase [Coprinopsis sp. MPI-PUGE-AT-0042]|nr:NADH2 dehydrogenase [Coprinopsis sp. MPI-PUGE-AT-0042]